MGICFSNQTTCEDNYDNVCQDELQVTEPPPSAFPMETDEYDADDYEIVTIYDSQKIANENNIKRWGFRNRKK